jgi:hypothetical protein
MISTENLLSDYQLEDDFARANHVSSRTVARYRNQPDGLPYAIWGGKVLIHIPGARVWLAKKTHSRNVRRGRK